MSTTEFESTTVNIYPMETQPPTVEAPVADHAPDASDHVLILSGNDAARLREGIGALYLINHDPGARDSAAQFGLTPSSDPDKLIAFAASYRATQEAAAAAKKAADAAKESAVMEVLSVEAVETFDTRSKLVKKLEASQKRATADRTERGIAELHARTEALAALRDPNNQTLPLIDRIAWTGADYIQNAAQNLKAAASNTLEQSIGEVKAAANSVREQLPTMDPATGRRLAGLGLVATVAAGSVLPAFEDNSVKHVKTSNPAISKAFKHELSHAVANVPVLKLVENADAIHILSPASMAFKRQPGSEKSAIPAAHRAQAFRQTEIYARTLAATAQKQAAKQLSPEDVARLQHPANAPLVHAVNTFVQSAVNALVANKTVPVTAENLTAAAQQIANVQVAVIAPSALPEAQLTDFQKSAGPSIEQHLLGENGNGTTYKPAERRTIAYAVAGVAQQLLTDEQLNAYLSALHTAPSAPATPALPAIPETPAPAASATPNTATTPDATPSTSSAAPNAPAHPNTAPATPDATPSTPDATPTTPAAPETPAATDAATPNTPAQPNASPTTPDVTPSTPNASPTTPAAPETTAAGTQLDIEHYQGIAWTHEDLAKIQANLPVYQQAAANYDLPWEFLAVIHKREHNLEISNPSNGQGIYQFYAEAGAYPPGDVTHDEFLRQTKYLAKRIREDYSRRGMPDVKLTAESIDAQKVMDTFGHYNGLPHLYRDQAIAQGYRADQAFMGSPYVVNMMSNAQNSDKNPNWQQYLGDGGNIGPANHQPGAWVAFKELLELSGDASKLVDEIQLTGASH